MSNILLIILAGFLYRHKKIRYHFFELKISSTHFGSCRKLKLVYL